MFGITRKRSAGILMALTMTLVLVLVLAASASAAGHGPIVHRVHVGGQDFCAAVGLPPGCDANWSLVAIKYADGSVSGQLTDRWRYGGSQSDGLHAVIDCLAVDGNTAWVSGVITQGSAGDSDLAGLAVATRVQDNGTSANDPADQISPSWIGEGAAYPCTDRPEYPLFDVPQGQVVVE